jgi:hypothetical protein
MAPAGRPADDAVVFDERDKIGSRAARLWLDIRKEQRDEISQEAGAV